MLISVFMVSFSVLAFEILMTRVFSISQWHHLSFMVISIAMFGLAASGTYLSLIESRTGRVRSHSGQQNQIALLSLFYVASAVLSFYVVKYLPLDYYKLPIQPVQALYILLTYISLAAPFFVAGLLISKAYIAKPEISGLIYFASMAGSALGAIIPMVLLGSLGEGKLLLLMALFPLTNCFFSVVPNRKKNSFFRALFTPKKISWMGLLLGCLFLVGVLGLRPDHPAFRIPLSDYKGLHQLLQYPDSHVIKSTNSISGRVDTVKSPFLRYSPGLSLQYDRRLPPQLALFKDGDSRLICYDPKAPDAFRFATYTIANAGYLSVPEKASVLIIQQGGGSAIACALSSSNRQVTVVEKSPQFAEQIDRHYHIPAVSISPEIFLARTTEQYDIIHMENWGTSLPGTSALTFDPMFTSNAIHSYFAHLSAAGVLVLTRKLVLPPSNMIRIAANVYQALQAMQISEPHKHMVILRNWDTFAVLVFKTPPQHIRTITGFANEMNFDLVWPQDAERDLVNHFNRFEKPFYAEAIQSLFDAMSRGKPGTFFRQYPLDVRPQTNNRPFPDKFFKWSRIKTIQHMTGNRLYTLLLSGEIIVGIVFLEAVLIAGLLLFGPIWIGARQATRPTFRSITFFACLGIGYMLVELYFIYLYIRIFNHPVISFSIVLTVLLVASGIGGLISQGIKLRCFLWVPAAIALLVLSMIFWFEPSLTATMRLPFQACVVTASLLMVPVGVLMGVSFPLAIRYVVDSPAQRAYAWAVNGSASVLAAIVSAQTAITWGLTSLLGCAVVAYAVAGVVLLGYKSHLSSHN